MHAYNLIILDESITDKVLAFFKSLPSHTVELSENVYNEELEKHVNDGFSSPLVGTHEEVFAKLHQKYAY